MAWSQLTLATDEDLTNVESRMPEMAKAVRNPQTGKTAFDGKRDLAKSAIYKRLVKKAIDPDSVTDATVLTSLAVYKELELIFRDMGSRNDSVSMDKASFYAGMFEDEMEYVLTQLGASDASSSLLMIPAFRA
jgi:hypothetical protein